MSRKSRGGSKPNPGASLKLDDAASGCRLRGRLIASEARMNWQFRIDREVSSRRIGPPPDPASTPRFSGALPWAAMAVTSLALTSAAGAGLIAYDGFDYTPPGQNLSMLSVAVASFRPIVA
jgi:hypothetical protein